MTGGIDGYDLQVKTSVEVSIDFGISWCSLPDLPRRTYDHSQSGLTACGGADNKKSCLTFSAGVWQKTHNLLYERDHHVAWDSPCGILLMGGLGFGNSSNTTEIINDDGQSIESFKLYERINSVCAIELREKVIITGGDLFKGVRAYNNEGFMEAEVLPDLLQKRKQHGCGHFVNGENKIVYLVAGGFSPEVELLSSTEIFEMGSESWIEVGKLPSPLSQLKGISINNKVIMTGGRDEDLRAYDTVLHFNITSKQWKQVGEMTKKRYSHGVSFVPADILNYCSK